MAIAQRHSHNRFMQAVAQPLPRPARVTPGSANAITSDRRLLLHLSVVAVFAVLVGLRVLGYCQMTAANYENIALRQTLQKEQARNQRLINETTDHSADQAIEHWAGQNGMVRPAGNAVVLTKKGQ